MNKTCRRSAGLLAAGFLLAAAGCGAPRKTRATAKSPDSTASVIVYDTAMRQPPPVLPPPTGIAVLLPEAPAFNTFSTKAKAEYETGGDRKEFSMVVRIQNGKAIWVSVNALGGLVNVARALITPDSVQAINYLQREAYRMRYSDAGRLLPVSVPFETLQAVLTGAALFSSGARTASETPDAVLVEKQDGAFTQRMTVRKSDSSLQNASLSSNGTPGRTALELVYTDYSRNSGRLFARKRTAAIDAGGKQGTLRLDFDEPVWDRPLEMPFSIPSKYTLK